MVDISDLKFDANGLIPAVVVDAGSGAVLTLAYMNSESLRISIDEGRTCFWSRSRGELWRKGETSGNLQRIVSITADCDRDALVVVVEKDGPACHTGADSCFSGPLFRGEAEGNGGRCAAADCGRAAGAFSLGALFDIISDRKANRKPGSYTTYLFDKGVDKILKKVGEESAEVIIAGKSGIRADTVYEIADLAYHALVLMAEMGITPDDVTKELASRHVADET